MNIAIAGFGIEGLSSYNYWNRDENSLTIVDENENVMSLPEGARTMLGANVFSQLKDFDLVIRSPSINPSKLDYGDKVWSVTNEFLAKSPATIIGVTGTKGKGTTSSLIHSILKAAGRDVHLVGNIGQPALDSMATLTSESIVVYELSSFQLWDIKSSPHISVVLPIEADHLDVHDSFDDYLQAKANIVAFQHTPGSAIVAKNTSDIIRSRIPEGVDVEIYTDKNSVYMQDDNFCVNDKNICPTSSLKLPGKHNLDNACAAIAAALKFDCTSEQIEQGLVSFTGLPHRLKFVREVNDVAYYDDSIATTPGSAIAALRSFDGPKILILGGKDKGGDYSELIRLCKSTETLVIAMGENGTMIEKLCNDIGVKARYVEGRLDTIVQQVSLRAESGTTVILSPAAASFDQYKNYSDRGDVFITAVTALY